MNFFYLYMRIINVNTFLSICKDGYLLKLSISLRCYPCTKMKKRISNISIFLYGCYLSIYLAFLCYIYLPIWWYLSYWKGGYLSYPFNYTYTLYTLLKYLINSIYLSIKADNTKLYIMADNFCIHLLRMHAKLLIYLSIKADNIILSIY